MGMEMGLGSNTNLGLEELPGNVKKSLKKTRSRPEKQRTLKEEPPAPIQTSKPPGDLQKTGEALVIHKKNKSQGDRSYPAVMVKVIDPETDKVIRELSSTELQRLRDQMRNPLGILFDEQI